MQGVGGEAKDILFLLCGHGHFDMGAYDEYFAGNLVDQSFSGADIDKTLASIPALENARTYTITRTSFPT